MTDKFQFQFTCEKCGGQFYSKADPTGWRHHYCNKCSGKPYKDYPVDGTNNVASTYQPKSVPTKPVYNMVQPAKVEKKVFNLDDYVTDMILVYSTLKTACEQYNVEIPPESLCAWTTSIMIQKGKME